MRRGMVGVIALVALALAPVTALAQTDQDYPNIANLVKGFLQENDPTSLAPGQLADTNPPLSPFGGDSQLPRDTMDLATLKDTFAVAVNPHPYPVIGDFNGDGEVELSDLVRWQAGQPGDSAWSMPPGPFDSLGSNLIPAFGPSSAPSTVQEVLDGMGFDPSSQTIDLAGIPGIVVAAPGALDAPLNGEAVVIWGGNTTGSLPPSGCGGQVLEVGSAFLRDGYPGWQPQSFAPNDLFGGASHAIVARCDQDLWSVVAFENGGSSFFQVDTHTAFVIHEGGYLGVTPAREFAGMSGFRWFTFTTPVVGGYQPDTTGFTASPAYPELLADPFVAVVSDPFAGTDRIGVFPFEMDFVGQFESGSSCGSPEWSGPFEAHVFADGNLALYQYSSGQVTAGKYTAGDPVAFDTSGSGSEYMESFSLMGSTGTYAYMPGDLECPYAVTIRTGFEPFQGALLSTVPGPEPEIVVTPSPPVGGDLPGDEQSQDDPILGSQEQPADPSGFPAIPLIIGGTVLAGAGYLLYRGSGPTPVASTPSGDTVISAPPRIETTPPPPPPTRDAGDDFMDAFIGAFGGDQLPPGSQGRPDHLSDADWRAAIHMEELAQDRIERDVTAAFEGYGDAPGVYDGFRDFLAATDSFMTRFVKMLSATTAFQGLLREWAEVQEIARKQDLAFAIVQVAWGGFSISRFINAPRHVPWHRSTLTGRMMAQGSSTAGTTARVGTGTAGGIRAGDALSDTARGADNLGSFAGNAATARQKTAIPLIPAERGAHSVYVHGSQAGQFVTDSGKVINFERVISIIQSANGWVPGKPIRLVSCHSGSHTSNLAARVAQRLGVWVKAPTHKIYLDAAGNLTFHADDIAKGAGWVVFNPQGQPVYKLLPNGTKVFPKP